MRAWPSLLRRAGLAMVVVLMCLGLAPLHAQDSPADEGSWLERQIEGLLSGAGRDVRIRGFSGALSSQARFEELTIADDTGIWLTISGGAIDWSRAALLRKRLEIKDLSAKAITLARLPTAPPAPPSLADTTARPFALPDLPVRIAIDQVETARLELGAPVLGQAATLSVSGALGLEGGAGNARLSLERADEGAAGKASIQADYSNKTNVLRLDLVLDEAPGGLVATALKVPGAPALDLSLKGAGPLSDFSATLQLASDDQLHLSGRAVLRETPATAPETGAALGFQADLSGDITPLLAAELRPFFGPDTGLELAGQRRADGALELEKLALRAAALSLEGSAALAPSGLPERFALSGRLGAPGMGSGAAAAPVRLPLPGPAVTLRGARISASFDAQKGTPWQASAALEGLSAPDLVLERAALTATGEITAAPTAQVNAALTFAASGMAPTDPALARALGPEAQGSAQLAWAEGGKVRLSGLDLAAAGAQLRAEATLAPADPGLPLEVNGTLQISDLQRFSDIAKRPLGGALSTQGQARLGLLDRTITLALTAQGQEVALGEGVLDALLAGQSQLSLTAARDATGSRIEQFSARTESFGAEGSAALSPQAGQLALSARLAAPADLPGRLSAGPAAEAARALVALGGAITLETRADWKEGAPLEVSALRLEGPGLALNGAGTVEPGAELPALAGTLSLELERLERFATLAGRPALAGTLSAKASATPGATKEAPVQLSLSARTRDLVLGLGAADRLIGGQGALDLAASLGKGALVPERAELRTPELRAVLSPTPGRADTLALTARLNDLGVLLPEFPGIVRIAGTITPGTGGAGTGGASGALGLDLSATGPGGAQLAARGQASATPDLALSGSAPLGLANVWLAPAALTGTARFDLQLRGALALSGLSGSVSIAGARANLPQVPLVLTDLALDLGLDGTRAQLGGSARAAGGGGVALSGGLGLEAPFPADLALRFNRTRVQDPALFNTELYGEIGLKGPLAGGGRLAGALTLGPTEVLVPESGMGSAGPIPEIVHEGAPAAAEATRARAGLLEKPDAGPGRAAPPLALDLAIEAPRRIFLRGRGLDAEFGGAIRLGGTADAPAPVGQFDLVRGRLDFMSSRLTLTEGAVALSGTLDPVLRVRAETDTRDGTRAGISLSGPASNPEIAVFSEPALPDDEVLALLVFGRDSAALSPFQVVQLANAAATLAGRGSAGIVERLRRSAGLDDLDIEIDDRGAAQLTIGKYLSENLYTDLKVDSEGRSEIDLNLDLTPSVTARGRVTSAGRTGLGVFLERDY